jgi:hypothetical protein
VHCSDMCKPQLFDVTGDTGEARAQQWGGGTEHYSNTVHPCFALFHKETFDFCGSRLTSFASDCDELISN